MTSVNSVYYILFYFYNNLVCSFFVEFLFNKFFLVKKQKQTAIQPLSKRRNMRNIIQAERYKCHPMRKIMDAMAKHRIKRENFIHKNKNSTKTGQCNYSSPPMSSEQTNQSLTIRTTIHTVTRDQEDTSKKLLTLSHIDDFYPQATLLLLSTHSHDPC